MKVVHVHASKATAFDVTFIELLLGMVEGVKRIATIESLGLISVMFDEDVTDSEQIIETVGLAGFDARGHRPALA